MVKPHSSGLLWLTIFELTKFWGDILKKWLCVVCGFVYDEAKGLPLEGIAAGTRWENIPDDWICPDCGMSKASFKMMPLP